MPLLQSFCPLLARLTITALALPTPQASSDTSNGVTHIYICTDASFSGSCANLHVPVSECVDIPPEYAGKVSSAGPDLGTFCTLYSNKECHGDALPFTNPGIRELKRYGYDDEVQSVRSDFMTGFKSHP
ncbi:hypothetical protein EK21DRAFT_108461 [Setomelanomma holmii]|uniref:Sodefrin-like factor n=1 Tax=Setomelanomma holmii TaxID=210430 RepID=A0A9P4HF79_9PLEO|nr:hypothetical protein EK21DRAFT_108461 [Setomelanomma holmii]